MPLDVTVLPMFPLGSVLFPEVPLPLRVFEPRYLQMLQDVLQGEVAEFGVVLIERGREVGGGDHRFGIGTVARITALEPQDGFVALLGVGSRRVEVVEWLGDDPYPRATVRAIEPLAWGDSLAPAMADVERLVRHTLARAGEFDDQRWSASIELDDDPLVRLWQLAAIAPVGPMDQQAFLGAASASELVDAVGTATHEVAEDLDARGR